MKTTDIGKIRLFGQQISSSGFSSPKEVVSWMGAMQAQDFAMSKWAIGLRLTKATEQMVEVALDRGEIIRTHLMRPTWHLVAAADIYWMLDLTAPQILTAMKSRHKQLEMTPELVSKSQRIIVDALSKEDYVTRDALVEAFKAAKIPLDDNRAAHLLLLAELHGLICSGKNIPKKQTYALLSERVPHRKTLPREEALARLAQKYFQSHYPATLQDFIWWSGLSVTDGRQAVEQIKSTFFKERINGETYWMPGNFTLPKQTRSVYLLPAYDEYIISYRDRTAVLNAAAQEKVISKNGIFWPVIVSGGKVRGLWKRTVKKEKVVITPELFEPLSESTLQALQKQARIFGKFLEKRAEVI